MKRTYILITLAIASQLNASSNVTSKPGDFVLRNKDNTEIDKAILAINRFPNQLACETASKRLPAGSYKCDQSIALTVTTTCADEAKPVLPEGENVLHSTLKPGSDTEWIFSEIDYIHNPKWPDGYPNCWIKGDVPAKFSSENDPELPNTQEPVTWPAEIMAERATPESCLARHEMCVIYPKGSEDENCGAPPAKCLQAENFYK